MPAQRILFTNTNATGDSFVCKRGPYFLQANVEATIVGTGSVSASVLIEGSITGNNWVTLGTISLSGTTTATDGMVTTAWPFVRATSSSVTGTVDRIVVWLES